jgi:glyceraldehyde 3-phosphate dehydrogenase
MTINVAINGYGRIGRNILRALYEAKRTAEIRVVAINDLADSQSNVHLTRYDSTFGRFPVAVEHVDNGMVVGGDRIPMYAERAPQNLPWAALGVDVVLECSGVFTSRDKAQLHLAAGAKKVLISAPGKDADATIVYGVNHTQLKPEHTIVSNASCTTNCLAPLAQVLHSAVGIDQGLMTTIHAYTNDQALLDTYHSDLRRARSATQSMIPTKTGAAVAVGLVLPELDGKLDGFAMRVPTNNVSVVDLTFTAKQKTSVDEINRAVKQAASSAQLQGILVYNEEPLVSIDFNHQSASSIFDATQTKVINQLVKVLSWYDNEWGFSNRMLDTSVAMMRV